jgi:hypothetical protein
MKEELISLETAKLAKEKGFDLETLDFFHSNDKVVNPFPINELDIMLKNNRRDAYYPLKNWNFKNNYNDVKNFSRPTQSLLQKWLREKHKILLSVDYNSRNEKWFYHIHEQDSDECFYKTYEEALEVGLKVGLEIIKK